MKLTTRLLAMPLCLIAGMATAQPQARFAATCTGTETVQSGDQPVQTLPFSVSFSADLPLRRICYDRCKRDDTYRIANIGTDPIRFADVDIPGQKRRITYSLAEARLTDDQDMTIGPIRLVRHAVLTCRPAPYRQPPEP